MPMIDRRDGGFRLLIFIGLLAFSTGVLALALSGCGGSGGSTEASGTVNISMSTAPAALVESLSPPSPARPLAGAVPAADNIDHAWITVERIALLPGGGGSGPDPDGEMAVMDGNGKQGGQGAVWADIPAEEVDLMNLSGDNVARFLNAVTSVPAGTYGKIRLYYRDPKVHFIGDVDNTAVHGTAHYHLDLHFVGDDLVIPVATGGGVRFYEVGIIFVLGKDGLKITVNNNNILMRPQVFATVQELRYSLAGTVDNVDADSRTFDMDTGDGRSFDVSYGATGLFMFSDGTRTVQVAAGLGALAVGDNAVVTALGKFDTGGAFMADTLIITFPCVKSGRVSSGTASSGWNPDNTFVLDLAADNVVSPRPDRAGAFYDNGAYPYDPLSDGDVKKGSGVIARGYAVPGGVGAFWITIGP